MHVAIFHVQYRYAEERKERIVTLTNDGTLEAHKDSAHGRAFSSAADSILELRTLAIDGKDVVLVFNSRTWRFWDPPADVKEDLIKSVITSGMLLYQGPPRFRLPVSEKGVPLFDLSKYTYFVPPPDEQLCIENMPPGFERKQAPDGKFYFVDHANQETSWSLPPNAMELIRLSQLRKYPRYLPDRGFFCSLQTRLARTCMYFQTPSAAPYWATPTNTTDIQPTSCKEGRVLDLDHLIKHVAHHEPKDIYAYILPAITHALSYTKFFKGLKFSGFSLSKNENPDFLLILRAALPNLTMLNLSIDPGVASKKVPIVNNTKWMVSVHAVRNLPKTDLLGSCDPVSVTRMNQLY